MPAQIVTDGHEIVTAAEFDEFVRGLEVELIGLRLEVFPLHVIFGGRRVKLVRDQFGRARVGAAELPRIKSHSDKEVVFKRLLETGRLRRLRRIRFDR